MHIVYHTSLLDFNRQIHLQYLYIKLWLLYPTSIFNKVKSLPSHRGFSKPNGKTSAHSVLFLSIITVISEGKARWVLHRWITDWLMSQLKPKWKLLQPSMSWLSSVTVCRHTLLLHILWCLQFMDFQVEKLISLIPRDRHKTGCKCCPDLDSDVGSCCICSLKKHTFPTRAYSMLQCKTRKHLAAQTGIIHSCGFTVVSIKCPLCHQQGLSYLLTKMPLHTHTNAVIHTHRHTLKHHLSTCGRQRAHHHGNKRHVAWSPTIQHHPPPQYELTPTLLSLSVAACRHASPPPFPIPNLIHLPKIPPHSLSLSASSFTSYLSIYLSKALLLCHSFYFSRRGSPFRACQCVSICVWESERQKVRV